MSAAEQWPGAKSFRVMVSGKESPLLAGYVRLQGDGWRFYPFYQAFPSRKAWPTPEAAVRLRRYWLEPNVRVDQLALAKVQP